MDLAEVCLSARVKPNNCFEAHRGSKIDRSLRDCVPNGSALCKRVINKVNNSKLLVGLGCKLHISSKHETRHSWRTTSTVNACLHHRSREKNGGHYLLGTEHSAEKRSRRMLTERLRQSFSRIFPTAYAHVCPSFDEV